MLDPIQLREHVVIPTLKAMGAYSEDAMYLICETALIESNLNFIAQKPKPIARGLWQHEKATYEDLKTRCENEKPGTYDKICYYLNMSELPESYIYLTGNLYASCAMARLKYLFNPDTIPDTVSGRAYYWSTIYNTKNVEKERFRYVILAMRHFGGPHISNSD